MTEVIPEAVNTADDVAHRAPRQGAPSVQQPETEESRWLGLAVLGGLLAWLGIGAGWEYIVVVLSLVFMIFMHELGHYLAARWGGMKATEFFLGFGPKLWSFKRGETEYGIKGIWAGAYVKVIGMNNLDEVDPVDEPRTYRQASYPKRMLVAVAGSGMHFLMALVTIYAVIVSSGLELDRTQWTVSSVPEELAAAEIGIEEGDRVVAGDGIVFETFDDMRVFVEQRGGQDVTFDVLRDGEILSLSGTIGVNDETGLGRLGVGTSTADLPREQFGVIGAVAGHYLLGYGLSMISLFGLIADTVIVLLVIGSHPGAGSAAPLQLPTSPLQQYYMDQRAQGARVLEVPPDQPLERREPLVAAALEHGDDVLEALHPGAGPS